MTSRSASPRYREAVGHEGNGLGDLAARYGCGPVKLTGADDALYERRLIFDHVVAPEDAGPREQFEAVAGPIRDVLLDQGDYFMHLADLTSYVTAQSRVSVLNVARSGRFPSDRTITGYAESIWGATPCPVD